MILLGCFAKYIAFLFFYFFIDKFITNFFFSFYRANNWMRGRNSSKVCSSLKKSSLFVMIGGRAEEVMEDYPIIVDELSILE